MIGNKISIFYVAEKRIGGIQKGTILTETGYAILLNYLFI